MKKNKANTETLINSNKKIIRSKKVFFASLSVLCASSGLVIANDSTDCGINPFYKDHPLLCAKPELGVDFGFTQTQFKDSADKMFNRKQFPINFFFGFNVTERFGIEVGYGETRRKHKQVTLGPGEFAPGAIPVPAGQSQGYDTSLSTSQPYFSIKYKFPIKDKLHLFVALGVTMMKMHNSWENITDSRGPGGIPRVMTATARSYDYEIRKTIPLIRIGSYYELNKSFDIRFMVTWIQTSKFKEYIPTREMGVTNGIPTLLKNKDNINYSLGIVYKTPIQI